MHSKETSGSSCFNGAALFTGRRVKIDRLMKKRDLMIASMGPPFLPGGENREIAPINHSASASMGPPFLPGGELMWWAWEDIAMAIMLQWGRPFYRAERIPSLWVVRQLTHRLQWGRPFYRAERLNSCMRLMPMISFNGAALFTGRRVLGVFPLKIPISKGGRFNGAALFTGRRERRSVMGAYNLYRLQWGRPFYRAERQCENARTQHQETAQQASMGPPFLPGGEAKI